jgi:hypothetical protein
MIQRQPRQIAVETLFQKNPSQIGLAEWLNVKALSSSPSTTQKKKRKKKPKIWSHVSARLLVEVFGGRGLSERNCKKDPVLCSKWKHDAAPKKTEVSLYASKNCGRNHFVGRIWRQQRG